MGQTSHIRPTTCGSWICRLGPGRLIPQLGLTSSQNPICIRVLGPLTLGPTFMAAGYAGWFRADFRHKRDLTSCPGTINNYNYLLKVLF